MTTASTRNWRRTSLFLAPMALRVPISRGALGDGDQHDVHDADAADEERNRGDAAQQEAELHDACRCAGEDVGPVLDHEIVGIGEVGEVMALRRER